MDPGGKVRYLLIGVVGYVVDEFEGLFGLELVLVSKFEEKVHFLFEGA